MPKEYVAYEGEQFTIEWYYSPKGESQAHEYYLSVDASDRIKVLKLFKMWVTSARSGMKLSSGTRATKFMLLNRNHIVS